MDMPREEAEKGQADVDE
jgi:hypothetical protein